MRRRQFLKMSAGSVLAMGAWPVGMNAVAPGGEAELLEEARERIRRHRQRELVIEVRAADERPLPGAIVAVDQIEHDFKFGCNLYMFDRMPTAEQEEAYRRRFAALLNFATLGFYWGNYERERGRPDYAYTDRAVAWCRELGITCKGHPLVWDYTNDPRWLPDGFEEIRALSHGRVREIVSRFRRRIDIWDVVNEPTHLGRTNTRVGAWAQSLSAVRYVAEHLKVGRAANPQATLLVNDYRTDPPYYQILDSLRENGRLLFDAVGIQSHMHNGLWPLRKTWAVCDQYAQLGVPLHFTETTVVSGPRAQDRSWQDTTAEGEARQAEDVPRFYVMLFGHPAVEALTWWDFSDHGAWQRAPAGLVRKDMSPKPVYDRLQELIHGEWWTRGRGRSLSDGRWVTRAFFGRHRVTVEAPGGKVVTQEVELRPGLSAEPVILRIPI